MPDQDDPRSTLPQTGDRTVLGGAPVAGGPTMASGGAFDTAGGGDLGGPGSRDPGDATSHLRDPVHVGGSNEQEDQRRAQGQAQSRSDADEARGLQDDSRASADLGSLNDDANR